VAEIEALGGRLGEARAAIATRIIGQEEVVTLSLAAMLSGGHALLMGLPGLGKTLLGRYALDRHGFVAPTASSSRPT
jgi:MoxR-like ATPase